MPHTAVTAPAKRPRTEAQIAASRANGAKSRGPKTAAGKRRSSQNACKHGFYTKRGPTISRRRARRVKDDYEKRLRKYTESFKPQTPYETELVALLAYTRERVWFFRELETRTFNQALLDHRAEIEEMRPKLRKGMLLHHELAIVFPYIRTQIVLINNYERRYLRIWRRILWELLRIQFANLRNEPAKPPAESMLLQLLSPDKPVPLARPHLRPEIHRAPDRHSSSTSDKLKYMTKEEIIVANKEFLFPSVFHYFQEPLVISHAKDQYVWDADGNQYLDFFGGIVTVSVGHCNETVTAKMHRQLDTLQHVSTVFANEPQAALAQKLASITPERKLTKSFFTNSGTEANETAILAARCYTGTTEIVALRHSYHGRSNLAMGLTGQGAWKLGAPQPGIIHTANAYCYRCPFDLTYPSCGVQCARDLKDVIRSTTSGRVAGIIAEPIQGVGGFVTPPKEYFSILAGIVREHGGIFISDEVQTAWGRTGGKWFGIEHWGVVPDMITSAKGLGNGAPIGVTIARPEIADSMKGLTISTFGGNPVATTAAKAVLDFIEDQKLLDNCTIVGAYLQEKLLELKDKHEIVGDVRGMGLLQAIELVQDRKTKAPAGPETNRVLEAARENRILVGKGGMFGNVLRLSPPMNIGKADVDQFAALLDKSLAVVGAMAGTAAR